MALEQVRFLGSSITAFSCSLGWGNEASRLSIGLVDDVRNGDGFAPPDVGSPVYFNYQGWRFNGLLEHYSQDRGIGGNPLYSVTVVDPRVLLDGVQLILSDYYGQSFLPNVINVFGYLENSFGFGGSQRNESGIPYGLVVSTVTILTSSQQTLYGSPISYKGFVYNIDLSALPLLPGYYRVSAIPSMSLMEFINEICDAGACEYFFTLEGSTITLHTISRTNVPLKGIITQFVQSINGCVATSAGLDMVNETCSKLLIGGQVTDVFFVDYGSGDGDFVTANDNTIWYYWGTDNDGNLITSEGPNQDFTIDARSVLVPGVTDAYRTDINEMRAAGVSQDSWESFLWFNCFNEYEFDESGASIAYLYNIDSRLNFVKSTVQYKHNGYLNPHFRKTYDLGVSPVIDCNIIRYLMGTSPDVIINANVTQILYQRRREQLGLNREEVSNIAKLYSLVRSYADEHYGRKFMVLLPEVGVSRDPETLELLFSHNVVDSGYLTDDVVSTAIQNNIMPLDTSTITTPDGRINAYVRFDNIQDLDLSLIEPEDLLFGLNLVKDGGSANYNGTKSVFVRCTVDENMVFLDNTTFTSPRAVITLTSRIFTAGHDRYSERNLVDFLNKATPSIVNPDHRYTPAQLSSVIKKFLTSTSGDVFGSSSFPLPVIPSMAAIPMVSNINTYGPWYSASANGKVEIEHAEDLVPWNYDGYTNMNLAANARVTFAIANMQWVESGSVEFPGVPVNQLGTQLLASGPYITDIRISIGTDGVRTSYGMKSWNPQFGRASKYSLDRVTKLIKLNQQIRRNMNQQFKLNSFKNMYLQLKNQLPNIQ